MEFPNLGKHCHVSSCNMLDFLPVKCDACSNNFCKDHMSYDLHNCPNGRLKDRQVPVCPLCGSPVPCPRNEPPDYAVSAHIDRDCQSDPAKAKRKVNANRCNMQGCRNKEIVPVICKDCGKNFCLKHRFGPDHHCLGKKNLAGEAAMKRAAASRVNHFSSVQGSLTEDEALAQALAASLKDGISPKEPQPACVPTSSQRCQVS